jgi:phage terminase large subunit
MKIDQYLNSNHKEFFQSTDREVLFWGGSGAGKTFSAADKILLQPAFQKRKLKTLIIRKTMPSLKRTCMPIIEERATVLGIPYKINKSDFTATFDNGSIIHYQSIENASMYERIKSITDVDLIWFEELNELTEDAYELALLRMRGGKGLYKQCFSTLNPISIASWVYDRFFLRNINDIKKIHSNVYDNPWIDQEYIKSLEALEESNYNLYKVYCLGDWGQLVGAIYNHYKIVDKIPNKIDEIIYGLDFGYNNPTALVRDYICDQAHYYEEVLYQTKLTNHDLIEKLKELNISKTDIIYADSAEPQRIEEIARAGFTIKPAQKNVFDGINFVKAQEMYVISWSTELIKELEGYCWKVDKDGNTLDEPTKFNDHFCDSVRYSCFTHCYRDSEPRAFIV